MTIKLTESLLDSLGFDVLSINEINENEFEFKVRFKETNEPIYTLISDKDGKLKDNGEKPDTG